MKFLPFVIAIFLLWSCTIEDQPPFENTNDGKTAYEPVLMTRTQLEKSIKVIAPIEINRPGKIYFKDGFIFLNEKYEGVHIIDNRNPKEPKNVKFIKVPGCLDMAIKNNTLYVDNAVDLVAIDLSGADFSEVSRQKRVFPELLPPDMVEMPLAFSPEKRPAETFIVSWKKLD
ncbi:hypothetical protein [Flexithrix dorotheae]|uniref:hypothetical protein n=1 Tax=Flexithrix dorotheae TaxID=70993 RepID=UPI00036F27EB|nr:hypothetical protein [Flexithrix dorotheae]